MKFNKQGDVESNILQPETSLENYCSKEKYLECDSNKLNPFCLIINITITDYLIMTSLEA